MSRTLDSDGRISGPGEKLSFKSRPCEIQSLEEKETSRAEAERGHLGSPGSTHTGRDSSALESPGRQSETSPGLSGSNRGGDPKVLANQFPLSSAPEWRRGNFHSKEVGAGPPWATSFPALMFTPVKTSTLPWLYWVRHHRWKKEPKKTFLPGSPFPGGRNACRAICNNSSNYK